MRTARWCAALLWTSLLAAAAGGCRDEQAGPRLPASPSGASTQVPASEVPRTPAAPPGSQGSPVQPPASPARGQVMDAAPEDLTFKSGATWGGGAVQYLGSKLEPAVARPGTPLKISHYFKALKEQPRGYGFFLHLVEPTGFQMLANLDHELQGGAMPLGEWPPGKVVEDIHGIMIPSGFSGSLRLVLGFWQGDQRLPVDDPGAQDGTDRMLGPPVRVEAGVAEAPAVPATPREPLPSGTPASSVAEVPAHTAKRAKKVPAIDGDLTDGAWADAEPVELSGSLDGRRPSVRTVARLLYDDQHLYLSFDCEDSNIWGTLFKRDDPIYTQEVVELFVDADGDGRTYNEIQVSPNNTLFDAYFPERRSGMDLSWDSGTRSAVTFKGTINNPSDRDQGWAVELAVPLARLAKVPRLPPRKGDSWRFNLYRLDGDPGRQEGMAFSPLFVGDFHHLPRFGKLNFD